MMTQMMTTRTITRKKTSLRRVRLSHSASGIQIKSYVISDDSFLQDPYYKKADLSHEHENFKQAEERLDKKHRAKIDKVMKEWSELDSRYQEMKKTDLKGAEEFKTTMTNRFQKVSYH